MSIESTNASIISETNRERPCSPDVLLGAYLISHLQQRCENCGTPETPQWRKGWFSTLLNRSVVLCNACGLKYNKNQFCPFCMYVYYKEVDKKSKHTWLSCETCHRWVHIECERKCGGLEDLNVFQPYCCPTCKNAASSTPYVINQNNNSLMIEAEVEAETMRPTPVDNDFTQSAPTFYQTIA